MAQLAKWSLPIPEVRGSIADISKVFIEYCFLSTVLKKTKIQKKSPGVAHFFKKIQQENMLLFEWNM